MVSGIAVRVRRNVRSLLRRVVRDPVIDLRRSLYTRRVRTACVEVGQGLKVNGPTVVDARTRLGNNVNFNGMTIAGTGEVRIGDNFHSGRRCHILTDNHRYNGDALPYDAVRVPRPVVIGDNVWLGDQVLILPGSDIGEGVVVQAGSVVHGKIAPLSVIGGNPATAFARRDEAHYAELKAAGRFF